MQKTLRSFCVICTLTGVSYSWVLFSCIYKYIRLYSNETIALVRTAARQRYQLLEYLYTLFYESHIHGEPVMRYVYMYAYLRQNYANMCS